MAEQDFASFLKETGLPTSDEVKKERERAFETYREKRKPLVEESERLLKLMGETNERMQAIKAPKAPELADVPAPPNSELRDPTQALGSLASVLAVFGSLKTRAPLTSALNAAAASMVAFHKGDKERVALQQEKWRDNLYRGLQQNQIEMQKYMNALQEANFDVHKAQSAFRVIAAQNDHVAMKSAIEAQDFEAQMSILDAGLKANHEAAKLWTTHEEKLAQVAANKEVRLAGVDARKDAGDARTTQKRRDESWKARNEFQKRVAPIDKAISGLDSAEVLLRGGTPGEKIEGARVLQRVIGGSERLKADASQMSNFGDIITRIQGWVSKGVWGELTNAQYQQLLSGMKSLREKETARRSSVEKDIRGLVEAGELDSAIVFGEDDTPQPSPSPTPAPEAGTQNLDYFLGKSRGR